MDSSETRRHFFDLKIPLGSLLEFYGILLLIYGIFGPADIYNKSLQLNVNLIWGVLMIVIGSAFLVVAYIERNGKK